MSSVEPSLRRRLLRWLLVPLVVLLAIDTGVAWWSAMRAADLAHDRTLMEIARELALHVEGPSTQPRLALTPQAERLLLVDPDDRLFFRVTTSQGVSLGGNAAMPVPPDFAPQVGGIRRFGARLDDEAVRVVATWIVPANHSAPVLVQVARTLNQRNALAREIATHALLPQLLLVALVLSLVYVGIGRGLQPLMRLRDALASRSHRDLRPIDTHAAPAEVQPLIEEVNQLMARLGEALDLRQRFIADAAHQLKTPVSGLKAQIELALRDPDAQSLRATMGQLHLGVDRLSRLVRQLLALARSEPGAVESLRLQPVDLVELALDVSMEWAPQALRSGIDLGFERADSPQMIEADTERLRELLNNLIDNAVRYSRGGGRVTVAVAPAPDGEVRLSVHDDGPEIPPEERTRIFERFHRLLGAPAEGSGLGLAIVHEIASLHRARITLDDDSDGVGNRFSVWFPGWSSRPPVL